VGEITDHYAEVVGGLARAPIIIGHSFGGLVTELLLDRGLGAAGVAISPAPVKGVLRLPLAQLRSAFPALSSPADRKRTVELTPRQFHYAFTNTMSDADFQASYERYHVPGPGRVLFQAAFANFNPNAPTKVDFRKDERAPLLVIGNDQDHTVPASASKEAAKRMGRSRAIVGYKEFAGRPHCPGVARRWEDVADYALEWATRSARDSADGAQAGGARPCGRARFVSAQQLPGARAVAAARYGLARARVTRKCDGVPV